MKKLKIGIIACLTLCLLGTMCVSAYSSSNKVARLYKKNANDNTEFRYLKMQATYNYSLLDKLNGNNQAIIRVHMGQRYDKQHYKSIKDPTRNSNLVNVVSLYWDDSRDPERMYRTYEYFTHYTNRDSTYNVTFLAELTADLDDNSTYSHSKCRFWTGQFYGDLGDTPFYVTVGLNDSVRPSDYYVIR